MQPSVLEPFGGASRRVQDWLSCVTVIGRAGTLLRQSFVYSVRIGSETTFLSVEDSHADSFHIFRSCLLKNQSHMFTGNTASRQNFLGQNVVARASVTMILGVQGTGMTAHGMEVARFW